MVYFRAVARNELTVKTTKALAPSDTNDPGHDAAGTRTTTGPRGSVADQARELPSRHRPWRWLLLAVPILGALAGGAWYIFVRQGDEETYLELQGNIDVRQVDLAFKVDGRIQTLAVDEGDTVQAGNVVATLDKRYFEDELRVARAQRDNHVATLARLEHGSRPEEIAEARAQLAQQRANLTLARNNLKRGEELAPSGGISKEDLDQRRESVDASGASVEYFQQALHLAEIGPRIEDVVAARALVAQETASIIQIERKLADCNLVAPNDGFILTRSREIGAIVQGGETVLTLTLSSPVWVRTYVNERDLGLVHPGMPASITNDTAPDRSYSARVGFISPTAEFTPKTVETRELRTSLVYRLRVVVDNPDGGLRQGMPVTVKTRLPQPRRLTLWERLRRGEH